eukprot:COSAG06_NODE_4677_length_4043_cov_3.965264_7_plen_60_part_00
MAPSSASWPPYDYVLFGVPLQTLLRANGPLHAQLVGAAGLEPLGELCPVLVVLEMKAAL